MVHSILTTQVDIGGIWRIVLFGGLLFSFAIFLDRLRNDIPFRVALGLFYVVSRALFILEYPATPFGDEHTAFQATAGQTLAEVVLITVGVLATDRKIWNFVSCIVVVEIFAVWFFDHGGLMSWTSLSTAFIALALPFTAWPIQIAGVATIAFHHGSTALLILAAQLVALALRKKVLRPVLFFIPVLAVIAYAHSNGPILDGGERLFHYAKFMTLWAQDWRTIVFGTGAGTFTWISLKVDNFKGDLFLQMHSDWLQIAFEYGLIGVGFALSIFWLATKKAWNNIQALCGAWGAAAFMITYHPLRHFPSAFVIALIVKETCVQLTGTDSSTRR